MRWENATVHFITRLKSFLDSLDQDQLVHRLNEFGLLDKANDLIVGNMSENEARELLFLCYDMIRSKKLAIARHQRRRARKRKKI
jgi:hypothetical protein